MIAVVTGASSGIGRDIAVELGKRGYFIYGIARDKQRLESLGNELTNGFTPIVMDLSDPDNCIKLFDVLKDEKINVFVNNAGFGVYGDFREASLERELRMIDLNIKALHILTRLFADKFVRDGSGIVLNVASTAGFMMGPLLSSYYASKAYVLRYSQGVAEELRHINPCVRVCVLCPGPVKTSFDSTAGVGNSFKGAKSCDVAKYAVKKMLHGKRIIIPGITNKLLVTASRFVPEWLLARINRNIQRKKA